MIKIVYSARRRRDLLPLGSASSSSSAVQRASPAPLADFVSAVSFFPPPPRAPPTTPSRCPTFPPIEEDCHSPSAPTSATDNRRAHKFSRTGAASPQLLNPRRSLSSPVGNDPRKNPSVSGFKPLGFRFQTPRFSVSNPSVSGSQRHRPPRPFSRLASASVSARRDDRFPVPGIRSAQRHLAARPGYSENSSCIK